MIISKEHEEIINKVIDEEIDSSIPFPLEDLTEGEKEELNEKWNKYRENVREIFLEADGEMKKHPPLFIDPKENPPMRPEHFIPKDKRKKWED